MYLFENPVLQRELVVNLRMTRAFLLLFAYIAGLGLLVYAAWPANQTLDLARPEEAKKLVNLFFLGQYLLVSLMAPSFAAGAITGEKERESYEMLLASPLRPGAIVLGKLAASLVPLAELMICSLPIVMLCLPLGGVSLYEVFAAYLAMAFSVALSGMISLWTSSYFTRTSVPIACISIGAILWADVCRRLLRPPDLGSGGKQAIDLETEAKEAIGLYIERDQFPDRLFAPPKRTTFLAEDANPIYDKEIRSEIFSQGTLMLRAVIQISMGLALFVMAYCLFIRPQHAPWYISYVLLFNVLIGPVFLAGSMTSERERATLDLLLTTLITPWQMLSGKLLSGLRVSSVLTGFLMWPVVLACIMPLDYWHNLPTMAGYFLIVAHTCVTTAMTGLFCSTLFRKSTTSLMSTYVIIGTMFLAPIAAAAFIQTFARGSTAADVIPWFQSLSPFSAAFNLPLTVGKALSDPANVAAQGAMRPVNVWIFWRYLAFAALYNLALLVAIIQLFRLRWRISE
jgi:ABC-type transport system involved in multi-copper enzyme maturation permease subunit